MPLPFKLTREQVIVAWSFLSPMLKARAAASAALWDDRVIQLADLLFSNSLVIDNFVRVINREAAPETFQTMAPPELQAEARAFAGNLEFVESFIRDTAYALNQSPYAGAVGDASGANLEVMPFAEAKALTVENDRTNGGAYMVSNTGQQPELGQPLLSPQPESHGPGSMPPHPAESLQSDSYVPAGNVEPANEIPEPKGDAGVTVGPGITQPAQPAIPVAQPIGAPATGEPQQASLMQQYGHPVVGVPQAGQAAPEHAPANPVANDTPNVSAPTQSDNKGSGPVDSASEVTSEHPTQVLKGK